MDILDKVNDEEKLKIFAKYKIDCIKYHQQFANKLELHDVVVEKYDYNEAIKHYKEKSYYQYLIKYSDNYVGMVEYKLIKSEIDDKEIVYIDVIYIDEKYRGNHLAKKIINYLKEKYDTRIELECWYEMPSNNFYTSLGMRKIKTRYML